MSYDTDDHHLTDALFNIVEHVDWGSLVDDFLPHNNHDPLPIEPHPDDPDPIDGQDSNTEAHHAEPHAIHHYDGTLSGLEADNIWQSSEASWPQFDPAHATEGIIGTPETSMHYWQQQCSADTCSVVSQLYGLEELTGKTFSQDELCKEAAENGWYIPGAGTPMNHMGKLLELHGIDVVREHGCSYDHLHDELNQGHKVWVSVDLDEIQTPGKDQDDSLAASHGLPGQGVNHSVQVIGIDDKSDPDIPKVILNDPAVQNGSAMMIPLGAFMSAWEDGRYSMVHTADDISSEHHTSLHTESHDTTLQGSTEIASTHEPLLRGYYTGEGLYHWNSDNTDRDLETGKIVHQY